MPSNHAPPYVLAMLVCDAIWRDPGTGKHTLLGTFATTAATDFPAVHPVMAFFIALTDGHGHVPLQLRLVSVDEEDKLFEKDLSVDFPDPRLVAECAVHAQNVTFKHPGEYRLQLFSGSEPLMERRFVVTNVKVPEKPE